MMPQHTEEYLKARAPLLQKWDEARKPHWDKYLAGEITHEQYCTLIAPSFKQYSKDLKPHWVEAGGKESR